MMNRMYSTMQRIEKQGLQAMQKMQVLEKAVDSLMKTSFDIKGSKFEVRMLSTCSCIEVYLVYLIILASLIEGSRQSFLLKYHERCTSKILEGLSINVYASILNIYVKFLFFLVGCCYTCRK